MHLVQLLNRNYRALRDHSAVPETLSFIRANASVRNHDPRFIKAITKVASNIGKKKPSLLDGLHGRLHVYAHEGIQLLTQEYDDNQPTRMRDHLHAYAGDFSAEQYRQTGNATVGLEAMTDYNHSLDACRDGEPKYAALQADKAARIAKRMSEKDPHFLVAWRRLSIESAELASDEYPLFAAKRLESAAEAARQMAKQTGNPSWYVDRANSLESARTLYQLAQGSRGRDTRRLTRQCEFESGETVTYSS